MTSIHSHKISKFNQQNARENFTPLESPWILAYRGGKMICANKKPKIEKLYTHHLVLKIPLLLRLGAKTMRVKLNCNLPFF